MIRTMVDVSLEQHLARNAEKAAAYQGLDPLCINHVAAVCLNT